MLQNPNTSMRKTWLLICLLEALYRPCFQIKHLNTPSTGANSGKENYNRIYINSIAKLSDHKLRIPDLFQVKL